MFLTGPERPGRDRPRRPAGRLALPLGLAPLLVWLAPTPALANPADPNCYTQTPSGGIVYVCETETPGEDGGGEDDGGDGGTGGAPACDLSLVDAFIGATDRFCQGENACWVNNPPFEYPDEASWPEEPPREGAVYVYQECIGPDGEIVFSDYTWQGGEEGPSLAELAQQAYGALNAPAFRLDFSPPDETLIFLDTWWWAAGAHDGEIVGTAALGVVAVGTPNRLEVDPGDGSDVLNCPVTTVESDACAHTYQRSSDGYPARARLVYDVRFEQNGEPFELPGLPEALESPWQETAVPVNESQATVVR
ncbi:hypothetical protein RM844_24790 [Streptomyces sp. DSM 44915]|uniref:Uncharacterized protein n=1 Tax=Streptomyces chisholmiae TaxID=3075540 RepID=A0ABU2JXM2_9ACTN|nr:hypothetical protein [Streptomyces sp. DSM 44915]MDT0269503.1 hypothetical protein [Streptomyces sp. DSM 44915]